MHPQRYRFKTKPRPVALIFGQIAFVQHLADDGIVEPVEILRQALALVVHHTQRGQQHRVAAQFGKVFAFLQMDEQSAGFFCRLGRVGGGVPAADEGVLQRAGQFRQFRHRQIDPAAVVIAQSIGPTGQQHPVAALQPLGQRVGQPGH